MAGVQNSVCRHEDGLVHLFTFDIDVVHFILDSMGNNKTILCEQFHGLRGEMSFSQTVQAAERKRPFSLQPRIRHTL